MKKSLVVFASVLLLVGAGCEEKFEDTTRSASETQETGDDDQRSGETSNDVKKEDDSKLEDGDDAKRDEVENESEDKDEKESDNGRVTPTATPAPSTGTSGNLKSYTMTDVAAHKDAASCWTAVNGSVYDVTTWIGKHPGGSVAIITLCGRDGSKDFGEQHSGQRRPEQVLAGFKIGTLAR